MRFRTLVVSQYFHIPRLVPQSPQGVLHGAVRKIPLKINKKAVFPVPILNGTALNLRHAQIIIDKMGQHMVK